jgi:hypothetical protein
MYIIKMKNMFESIYGKEIMFQQNVKLLKVIFYSNLLKKKNYNH